jgi:hypothetical protein
MIVLRKWRRYPTPAERETLWARMSGFSARASQENGNSSLYTRLAYLVLTYNIYALRAKERHNPSLSTAMLFSKSTS